MEILHCSTFSFPFYLKERFIFTFSTSFTSLDDIIYLFILRDDAHSALVYLYIFKHLPGCFFPHKKNSKHEIWNSLLFDLLFFCKILNHSQMGTFLHLFQSKCLLNPKQKAPKPSLISFHDSKSIVLNERFIYTNIFVVQNFT